MSQRLQAGGARAHDVHVVEVARVQRGVRPRARALQGELEDARVGFSTPSSQESMSTSKCLARSRRAKCFRSVPFALDTTTRRCPGRAQAAERVRHSAGHALPQVELRVVLRELAQGGFGGRRERDAGVLQHEVEVEPAPRVVVGGLDGLSGVELLLRVGSAASSAAADVGTPCRSSVAATRSQFGLTSTPPASRKTVSIIARS
jgi:hypothetical protein